MISIITHENSEDAHAITLRVHCCNCDDIWPHIFDPSQEPFIVGQRKNVLEAPIKCTECNYTSRIEIELGDK